MADSSSSAEHSLTKAVILTPDLLPDEALPGFFQDADRGAQRAQNSSIAWSAVRLISLVIAGVVTAVAVAVQSDRAFSVSAAALFGVALGAEIILLASRPERAWYRGRALAESCKTLAWRFAVRADPFDLDLGPRELAGIMESRLRAALDRVSGSIELGGTPDALVTGRMSRLREQAFADRRSAYLRERVQVQRTWYADKSKSNRRKAQWWRTLLIFGEVAGLLLAGGVLIGGAGLAWSAAVAAAVTAGAAWLNLRQHTSLAAAYSVAATELAVIQGRLGLVDEADWSESVADAEEAISREHTTWTASHSRED